LGFDERELAGGATQIEVLESICDQIVRIEQRLQDQLGGMDGNHWHSVWYEDFCRNPVETARHVDRHWIGPDAIDDFALDALPVLCARSSIALDVAAFEACRKRLIEGYSALSESLDIEERISEVGD
jgi:hypothetical protein